MKTDKHILKIWLSSTDTYLFARGAFGTGDCPCSELSGRRLFVEFEPNGDLVDMAIDGGQGPQDCQINELSACIEAVLSREPAELARFRHCIH